MIRELIRMIRQREDEPWLALLCSWIQIVLGRVRDDEPEPPFPIVCT